VEGAPEVDKAVRPALVIVGGNLEGLCGGDPFLHPFDDPLLWEGHDSLIDEVKQSGVKPDAVVLSVGGGGLLSGVVQGLQRNGWGDVPVIAVETEGAASFNAAVKAGCTIEIEAINSVATSLGAKRVSENLIKCLAEHEIHSYVTSDLSAVTACERFLADHRLLVEPACGASLALVYDHAEVLGRYQSVLVIVCGGATAAYEQIIAWKEKLSRS
jgi:L-serine/L-threonine ammonia-lyase